jgi:glycosyltransferase involved in cell wall biosynthesis
VLSEAPPGLRVLVMASTFPASGTDEAPAFVRDLVIALKETYPEMALQVLAPHFRDRTAPYTRHLHFEEFRFRYAAPRSLQRLTGRGIMPAITSDRRLLALVPVLFAAELAALLRHIRRERPDVIHAHWFTPQGVVAAIASRVTGVPFVLTTHSSDVQVWERVPLLGPVIVRALLPRADRITAVSSVTLARTRRFFSEGEWASIAPRVAIIPMGVDPPSPGGALPAELKTRAGFAGKQVLLFIGRLTEKKGVDHLLDAVAKAARDDVHLVVAGSGPDAEALRRRASQAGVAARVSFPGFITGAAKAELIRMCDAVVVPSVVAASGDAEGLPVVVLEALAAGKPCIATHESGAGDIIVDGDNGFLVPGRDHEALAARIGAVLALDPEARERLGDRARASARPVHWTAIAARHHDFLFAHLGKVPVRA